MKYPTKSFDHALWKQFWHKHQSYYTLCLPCIADKRESDRKRKLDDPDKNWSAVTVKDASEAIIKHWYSTANDNVFRSHGKSKTHYNMDISDDETDDDISNRQWKQQMSNIAPLTKSIAIVWLRTARAKLQRDSI